LGKIDDAHIKALVMEYQKSGRGYSQIVQVLSEYIYNYPMIRFRQSEDVCGEFFIYFFERLSTALMKYNVMDCQFKSWLLKVLRMHYLNWAKKSKRESLKSVLYLEDFVTSGEYLAKSEFNSPFEKENLRFTIIKKIIDSLPKKVRIVLKLYYFDFFEGADIKEISLIFKQDFSILMSKYEKILASVLSQYEKESELINKLNITFNQLLKYKEKLNLLNNEKLIEKNEIINKINSLELRHEKTLEKFRKFHVSVKGETISDFLGVSLNAIHNLVFRGKALLKEKLLDEKL